MYVGIVFSAAAMAWFGLQWRYALLQRRLKRHVEPTTSSFVMCVVRALLMCLVGMGILNSLGIHNHAIGSVLFLLIIRWCQP